MTNFLSRFIKDESGATAIEYGLLAAIMGIGIVAGLTSLRDALGTQFSNTSTALTKTY